MEVRLSLPHSRAGRTHSRNSISRCERQQKNHGISFPPTAASGHPALSSQAPGPSPPGRPGGRGAGQRGRTAARVSPCDPVHGPENSELFLLLQSG